MKRQMTNVQEQQESERKIKSVKRTKKPQAINTTTDTRVEECLVAIDQ
jgi:hypothetical protein